LTSVWKPRVSRGAAVVAVIGGRSQVAKRGDDFTRRPQPRRSACATINPAMHGAVKDLTDADVIALAAYLHTR